MLGHSEKMKIGSEKLMFDLFQSFIKLITLPPLKYQKQLIIFYFFHGIDNKN